jgi:broad specificity phosphatase PhoE
MVTYYHRLPHPTDTLLSPASFEVVCVPPLLLSVAQKKGVEIGTVSNSLYFLRHAEAAIDPSVPIAEWSVTSAGLQQTHELATSEVFEKIEGIVHSSEKKARQTADVFAKYLDVELYELTEFDELQQGVLASQEYRVRVRATLTDWDRGVPGWESGSEALRRFSEGVKRINIMFYSRNILVVTHGLILTLYFCELRNLQSIAYERWTQLPFLAWGLVREGRVLIDVI